MLMKQNVSNDVTKDSGVESVLALFNESKSINFGDF